MSKSHADFHRLIEQLSVGDHRTTALLGAAYVETYLTDLIAARLPGLNGQLRDRMFNPEGTVGTFSAKIDLARALNILTDRGRDSAILISRVRNRFAHIIDVTNFDDERVAKIVDKMHAFRGFHQEPNGEFLIDDADMTREETFTYLVKEFCFSISSELNKPERASNFHIAIVTTDELRVAARPPSPKKSRSRTRLPPTRLLNLAGQSLNVRL